MNITAVSAIILAGGQSSRMGTDKAFLQIHGQTFLNIQKQKLQVLGMTDILISGSKANMIPDIFPGHGPLGGIYSCLLKAKNPDCLVISVDNPLVPKEFLTLLLESHNSAAAPITILQHGTRMEPLIGVYSKEILPQLKHTILINQNRVMRFLQTSGYQCVICKDESIAFTNCNTKKDYQRMIKGQEPNSL